MKSLWTFLLALALLVDSKQNGHGASMPPGPAQKTFVPLSHWAKENDFNLIWTRKNESVVLTNASFKLLFKTDSPLAQINGVNVWLCQPIAVKNGQACISALDLNTSIKPILQGVLAYQNAIKS